MEQKSGLSKSGRREKRSRYPCGHLHPEQPKDQVRGSCSISHNLDRIETRLLFEQPFQNVERVSDCSWNNNGIKTAELVACKVIIGHAASDSKILTIIPRINCSYSPSCIFLFSDVYSVRLTVFNCISSAELSVSISTVLATPSALSTLDEKPLNGLNVGLSRKNTVTP